VKNENLSREISYALRHAPSEFGLVLDGEGWAELDVLVAALRERGWTEVGVSEVEAVVAESPKKRHEIRDGKIRAFYGHSAKVNLCGNERKPPEFLYHATARRFLASILKEGLKPMARQFVHLSCDIQTAVSVGLRRDSSPVVLRINAKAAHENGVKFYFGNENVWLCERVEAKWLEVLNEF